MTTTPQTEAQRLAALIGATLDSQDDSYLTCSVTKCLLQQAATELLRLDALRLELQTQLADYKDACTKAETRAVPASTGMHWTENEPVRLPASRAGRVYLAGPMTGLPELNFPAFTKEAERLRDEGLQVLNPADHGIVDGADWADYLRHDITGLASCERIHLLRGWTKSKGACLEMTIAKALGMAVTYQVDAEMEHNNAPAVAQGLERYEPTVMVEESRGRLTATGAVMKPKEDGRWVRLRDLTATPAPAPAQEVTTPYHRDIWGISHAMADLYYDEWVLLVRAYQTLDASIARMKEQATAQAVPQGWRITKLDGADAYVINGPFGGCVAVKDADIARVIPEAILYELAAALAATPAPVPAQGEPFGYFRYGWKRKCAEYQPIRARKDNT